jgi:hypothetical protein
LLVANRHGRGYYLQCLFFVSSSYRLAATHA